MDVVIIGNGISGITAAKWIRKLSDHNIKVISSESKHFFSRTALMYVYMGHMRHEDIKPYEDWFWDKNRIELIYDHVNSVDPNNKKLSLKNNGELSYDKLIIACGSRSNKFGWPGQDLKGVNGLYHLQDLEAMESFSRDLKRAVIVGGGLIGIEMAEMFHSRNIPVTMLVREEHYWDNVLPKEEAIMIGNHIREHHIDLQLGVNLSEILDDGNGRCAGVVVKETGEKIKCGYVGLTPGVSPNVSFLKSSDIEINRGVVVNNQLCTNHDDIYAIGDCAELRNPRPGRKPIEAVWYTGRMMGETVAYNICGRKLDYDPGIWFNSAKFIDIEYQVYGEAPKSIVPPLDSIFWLHEDGKKSVRIIYNMDTMKVKGFNIMGVRYRHEVCERWLSEETHMDQVMEQLAFANFDPEFFKSYEKDIIQSYTNKTGRQVTLKSKRRLNSVLNFLNSSIH